VKDLNEKGTPQANEDEINVMLANSGARAPDLSRLAQVASNMHHIEWNLLRRNAAAASGPRAARKKE
jgi:hypothetical protein